MFFIKYNLSQYRNRGVKGIFPKTYIQLVESVNIKDDYIIKRSEIIDEITTVLQEWHRLIKRFYLVRLTFLFSQIFF